MTDPILTLPEVAVLLKVAEKTVYTMAQKGQIPAFIFGELYGVAVESRFAKDVLEVPAWLEGGPEPTTITDGRFRPELLRTMRSRLSAA